MQSNILIQISPAELKEMIVEALGTVSNVKPAETLLSKKEVCELLGITLNTLDKFTKNGTIPAFGIGSRVMFKRSDVLSSLIRINK
ncbi:helix-turn-helix domain-containing protein [Flavobacterium sandaracinum]|nr:helix-turn-helix domain-containing protein [Flavobacterium sandaracinum]